MERVEIRTKMAEIQREYSALNALLKEQDEAERKAKLRETYKDYTIKVGCYGYTLHPEDKFESVIDEDREKAVVGNSGLVYTQTDHKDEFGYVMLKTADEYPRVKLLFERLNAAERIKDEKEKDKAKYVKILLGETDGT